MVGAAHAGKIIELHPDTTPAAGGESSGWVRWRSAIYLGLISSTFSTVVSQLSAGRIGRDAAVDWMSVAAIPARDWALSAEPSSVAVAIGIAFHQWADFSWALFFFGVLGRWTERLHPVSLALVAIPWAAFTSAFEWLVLVPMFPFWQPIFTLQQPYWIGFLVHLSSASMYPLYGWLRRAPKEGPSFEGRSFLRVWMAGAFAGIVALGALQLFALQDRELPWLGRQPMIDQTFMRHMSTHHQQGIGTRLNGDRKSCQSPPAEPGEAHGSQPERRKPDPQGLVDKLVRSAHAGLFSAGTSDYARPAQRGRSRTTSHSAPGRLRPSVREADDDPSRRRSQNGRRRVAER